MDFWNAHLWRTSWHRSFSACSKIVCVRVLDLSQNNIEDPSVIETFKQMPNLKVLYLKGNPFVQKIPQYRRRVIASLSNLTYLDERPVFPDERKRAEAWFVSTMDI
jgi:dynein assembly factor 1